MDKIFLLRDIYAKKIFFIYLFWFLNIESIDKEALYADIQDNIYDQTGEISLSLKQLSIKEVKERIAFMEQCKVQAWKDKNMSLRSRLHEEILYEKEPWYEKKPWALPVITFFVTGFTVAAIRVLIEKNA